MTGANLVDRKRAELRAKLDGVEAEFGCWRAVSERGKPLRKHHSQIRRTTSALEGMTQRILDDLNAAAGDSVLTEARRLERAVLEVHRLWSYFRSKLALRSVSWFQQPLYAVDELAWACYEPLQLAVAATRPNDLKEPPLSFFNGAWSPFASGRGRVYEPERVEGAMLTMTSAQDAIRRLPIPVVGVPWYLAEHLPDSPVVCHEVGHLAEQDFGLTEALDAALLKAAIPDARRPAWQSWRSEVFADVYGCLGAGPAFVSALMGFLAEDPAAVAGQKLSDPGWGKYPTSDLRMAFNFEVLRALGLSEPGDALETRWAKVFDEDHMSAFREDIGAVATAILRTPLAPLGDDVALADVLTFNSAMHAAAHEQACGLLVEKSPDPPDARRVHMAARLAFDADPALFTKVKAGSRALQALWDARDDGVRRAEPAPDLDEIDAADRTVGVEIYDAMSNLDPVDDQEEW